MKRRPGHQGFARPQFRERLPNGGPDCTRPDKHHHRSRTAAESHLAWFDAHAGGHDPVCEVYECRCGMGWVWGRR